MHLRSCLNPHRIYNRYIGEFVWTSCGRCEACKRRRAAKWIKRLEDERSFHAMTFFVTLTFSDSNLPLLKLSYSNYVNESVLVDSDVSECRSINIPLSSLNFSSIADKQYFRDCIDNYGGIPYFPVSVLQKFNKRLNKYFFDNVSSSYKNFRYFCVSEYGETSFRPHAHCLYFVDDKRVIEQFEKGVRACWIESSNGEIMGRIDCQPVESSACSYVANYLNQILDVPSFYEHCKLRPFFVFSKSPSIGVQDVSTEYCKKIVDNPVAMVPNLQTSFIGKVDFVPLHSSLENKLFPRVPYFRQISDYARIQLYRLCFFPYSEKLILPFKQWFINLRGWYLNQSFVYRSFLRDYIDLLLSSHSSRSYGIYAIDSPSSINVLRRLYYVSKRVQRNCVEFGYTIREYVDKIDLFLSCKELSVLKVFYNFQSEFSKKDCDSLVYMYPEYFHKTLGFPLDGSGYCVPESVCSDLIAFKEECSFWLDTNTKTHFKNDFFARKLSRGDPRYKSVERYYKNKGIDLP